jgi:predicted Zn-dependent protease
VQKLILGAALAALALVLTAAAAARPRAGVSLYLVALDDSSATLLPTLAERARQLGLPARVLPQLTLPQIAYDSARKQFVAEQLVTYVEGAEADPLSGPSVVIAVTASDMYIRALTWRFAFGYRATPVGLIATARFAPTSYGLPADGELFRSRVEKMFVRYLGLIALGRSESRNPYSVLRSSILSLDDVDLMTDEFDPKPLSVPEQSWITGADAACGAADRRTRGLVPTGGFATPAQFLAFANRAIDAESHALAGLRSLRGAPLDPSLARRMLSGLAAEVRLDEGELKALGAAWSSSRASAWLRRSTRDGGVLAALAFRLRVAACGRYFEA